MAFGLAYGLCLVSGLRECERLADADSRGAVVACYYALSYVGFGAPYLVAALNGPLGRVGTLGVLAIVAALTAVWTTTCADFPDTRVFPSAPAGTDVPTVKADAKVGLAAWGRRQSRVPVSRGGAADAGCWSAV